MAKKNMSFLPEDYVEKRATRRTNFVCVVLFIAMLIGLGAFFFLEYREDSQVLAQYEQVNSQFEERARRLEQLEELQARRQQMLRKAAVTFALVERVPRSLLLAELINHMPKTLSLLDLELETKVVHAAARPRTAMQREQQRVATRKAKEDAPVEVEVPETEASLSLIGVAPTDVEVAQFLTSLSHHSMFADVSLEFSEQTRIDNQDMRRFRIEMKLSRNVNLHELEPTRIPRELNQNPMGETIQIKASFPSAS